MFRETPLENRAVGIGVSDRAVLEEEDSLVCTGGWRRQRSIQTIADRHRIVCRIGAREVEHHAVCGYRRLVERNPPAVNNVDAGGECNIVDAIADIDSAAVGAGRQCRIGSRSR
jgi:hypothetical protein